MTVCRDKLVNGSKKMPIAENKTAAPGVGAAEICDLAAGLVDHRLQRHFVNRGVHAVAALLFGGILLCIGPV